MMLRANGKVIDTKPIETLFTQGERYADMITIVLDTVNNDMDMSDCTFTIRGMAETGEWCDVILGKEVANGEIRLAWGVSDAFTARKGLLLLELVGSKDDGGTVIKYQMPAVWVRERLLGNDGNVVIPDALEGKLATIQEFLDNKQTFSEMQQTLSDVQQEVVAARTVYGGSEDFTLPTLSERLAADVSDIQTLKDTVKSLESRIKALESGNTSGSTSIDETTEAEIDSLFA